MKLEYSMRISGTKPYPFAEIDKKVQQLRSLGARVVDFGCGRPEQPHSGFCYQCLCWKLAGGTWLPVILAI